MTVCDGTTRRAAVGKHGAAIVPYTTIQSGTRSKRIKLCEMCVEGTDRQKTAGGPRQKIRWLRRIVCSFGDRSHWFFGIGTRSGGRMKLVVYDARMRLYNITPVNRYELWTRPDTNTLYSTVFRVTNVFRTVHSMYRDFEPWTFFAKYYRPSQSGHVVDKRFNDLKKKLHRVRMKLWTW